MAHKVAITALLLAIAGSCMAAENLDLVKDGNAAYVIVVPTAHFHGRSVAIWRTSI